RSAPHCGEGVARGEDEMGIGLAGAGERLCEAGRALLEQGYVPFGAGQLRRELVEQAAVDLDVGLVALADPQQSRAQGEEPRVGGEVAPVEEVPGDRGELHPLSISALKRDFLTGEELGAFELSGLLEEAAELKAGRRSGRSATALEGAAIG